MKSQGERLATAVVLLDEKGRTVQTVGDDLQLDDPLNNKHLRSIRARMRACLKGKSFLTTIQIRGRKLLARVKGQPVLDDQGHITGMCLAIEQVPREKLSDGGAMSELEFVISNMRQGLWRLNSFGIITFANPYLAKWLELEDADELVGQHFSRYRRLGIVSPCDAEEGLSQRYEAEFVTQSGLTRRAIVVTSPTLDASGAPNGTVDLITDITAEHAVQAKLVQEVQMMHRLATTDPLTGVANRKIYDDVLEEICGQSEEEYGLVIIDLDHFKELNDTLGHEFGDKVLVHVAQQLTAAVRETDIVCRLGGDEFAIILPKTSCESMHEVGERLEKNLNYRAQIGEIWIDLQVSIGMAHSSYSSREVARTADRKMYERKFARKAKSA